MFEARLVEGGTLKKIIEAIKDLVTDANLDCGPEGVTVQALDSSHVALVSLFLDKTGFEFYRADRPLSLGINVLSMAKLLKCAGNDDIADDNPEILTFIFESPNQSRVSHFSLKLMTIDSEHLGVPDTPYSSVVQMPSGEFQRICKEMATIGDTVQIATNKDGIKFSVQGDMGSGSIICKTTSDLEDEADATMAKISEPVSQNFAVRYLNFFAKASPLSASVALKMSSEVPLVLSSLFYPFRGSKKVVEYKIDQLGHMRFYLAPKIDDDDK